jgi:flagellar basal-body rod protein FlgF
MQSGLYVALSGQVALERRIDTIANNIANASTVGFRAEEVKFESLISQAASDRVAYSTAGETYLSTKGGELIRTDNPLDVAVNGDAWMAVQTPQGLVYTRDGRMRMTELGDLQTLNGYPVLDVGGAPLQLDPNGETPRISRDGMIFQGNRQIGAIGLFKIDPQARLTRAENSGVVTDGQVEPIVDFSNCGVDQGFIERANINPVLEITKLITVQRNFESLATSVANSESTLDEGLKALGSSR